MSEERVAPVGGGFHVPASEVVVPVVPSESVEGDSISEESTPSEDEETDEGDCDACNRK